jgi:DNA-binding NarL/FixJ family response regulator
VFDMGSPGRRKALTWSNISRVTLSEAPAHSPIRVVLVDDSEDLRCVVRMALERELDFVVVAEAADGQEAVSTVAAHKPHLVLLDIAMPVMDGLQALTLIREESPGSIVVMLSAFTASTGAIERALSLGAHGYIQKGGGAPAMIAELRAVLSRFASPVPAARAGVQPA